MPTALILSSYVASSRVGGAMQALALAEFRFEPILVPTVLYGRHPGWGAPGGGPVATETFESMLDGVEANGAFEQVDVVITGYFASAAQVRAAARAIDAVRAATMGDSGKGLYVQPEVPAAITAELIRRADYVTPNAWELERLTGISARSPKSAVDAARLLGRPTLVSSVERGQEIGVVYADRTEAWFAAHARAADAPQGTGDLLTALFALTTALRPRPWYDARYAIPLAGVAETVASAGMWKTAELPVVAMGAKIKAASPSVRIERLS